MTPNEYVKLLDKINKEHQNIHMGKNKMRKIKYVSCNYDARDNSIYNVRLRQWFTKDPISFPREHELGKVPRVKEMYEDICKWLEETYE